MKRTPSWSECTNTEHERGCEFAVIRTTGVEQGEVVRKIRDYFRDNGLEEYGLNPRDGERSAHTLEPDESVARDRHERVKFPIQRRPREM